MFVDTGSPIFTRVEAKYTLVHILLAKLSAESTLTFAAKATNRINTCGSIQTQLLPALVYVLFTQFPLHSGGTQALKAPYIINARGAFTARALSTFIFIFFTEFANKPWDTFTFKTTLSSHTSSSVLAGAALTWI